MNRRLLFTLLALYVAFTLYNTFIPFQLKSGGPPTLAAAARQVFLTGSHRISLTDVVGNIILFIPFGLLCALAARRVPALIAIPATVVAAFAFSSGIEIIQTCFAGRVAWRGDIVNNAIGAFFGVTAVFLVPRSLARRQRDRAVRLIRSDPWTAGLLAFFVIAALRAWFPFNVVISVSGLKQGLKAAVVVPFGTVTLKGLLSGSPIGAPLPFDGFEFVADLWFWAFWGYLSTAVARSRAPAAGLAVAVLLLPPVLLEAGQMFIGSRTLDVNEFISGVCGAVLGCVYFALGNHRRRCEAPKYEKGLAVPFLAYVLFVGLAPFDFDLAASASPSAGHLFPFYAYFGHTSIWNLYDVFGALFCGAPLAFIAFRNRGVPAWGTAVAALLLGIAVEAGQLFLPSRTADITDPLLMAAGAWITARVVTVSRSAEPHRRRTVSKKTLSRTAAGTQGTAGIREDGRAEVGRRKR